MCGIVGIIGSPGQTVDPHEIEVMCDALVHRGPDDAGYFVQDHVGLGMRRLSIIDVKRGQQPAWNETRDVCVVLNGEIYNYQELRLQLIARGHLFTSGSDTEVIAHLYEEVGDKFVQQLRGMFAVALFDHKKQLLILARDRVGIKPLYYTQAHGRFLFASEMKALLTLPDIKKELNWASVSYLFSFLSTPPDESILSGIHKLEPGYLLRMTVGGRSELIRYWDVQFNPDHSRSEAETADMLRDKLREAVRYCMVSDVPVGAFLSGGLDSGAVVAWMARQQDTPVKTFSIGFPDPRYDESPYARQVAKSFGTEHHELMFNADMTQQMQELIWYLDEPFGDSSALPTYMVSKLAAQHVKVVLSGDGGDEIFAGYDKYGVEERERKRPSLPGPLRRLVAGVAALIPEGVTGANYVRHLALTGKHRYMDSSSLYARHQKQSLFTPAFSEQLLLSDPWANAMSTLDGSGDAHWLSSLQYQDIKSYLPLDILTKVDRMSMANSLEARVPLLDHPLIEFVATIPADMRMKNGTTKYIFKKAMRGILPDGIIDRRKQGFAVPLGQWFRGELYPYMRDILLSEQTAARGIFNMTYIHKLLSLHNRGRPLDQHLWMLISFELWCRAFLDQNLVRHRQHQVPWVHNLSTHRKVLNACPELIKSYSQDR